MKNQKGVSLITLIITIIIVIILAVIVLRSGASDAPDQAAFSKFTSQMGELQDAVKVAMLEAKADELLEGNQRTEAQLYNFIARGGYEGFEWERDKNGDGKVDSTRVDIPDEGKWLIQRDAEIIESTMINKKFAKTSVGQDLPVIEVETASGGMHQEISFFVTTKGTVFCWPPYEYDGKSYVNATTTVKDEYGNEMEGSAATATSASIIVNLFEDGTNVDIWNAAKKDEVDIIDFRKMDNYDNYENPLDKYWDERMQTPIIYHAYDKKTYEHRGVTEGINFDEYDNR